MAEPHESRIYSDFARFYDHFFGRAFVDHEHEIIEQLNLRPEQRVLEVGVGTGIALDAYPPYVHIVGIDPSADMLAQAIKRVGENGFKHIELSTGDALNLDFLDNSFDCVASFHVITVVPDPFKMMAEMVRVCKPGGRIVITTHFQSENPIIGIFGSIVNPVTRVLGWTSKLKKSALLKGQKITVETDRPCGPVHRLLIARKSD
jgi:phosphatidylethanolamine/phosphatidyl-N-methylethanolamine N-methyltransferase